MIIHANDELCFNTDVRIIDKKSGEDYTTTHFIEVWDTQKRIGREVLSDNNSNPIIDDWGSFMIENIKLPNAKTVITISKTYKDSNLSNWPDYLISLKNESLINKDLELKYNDNLRNETKSRGKGK